MSRLCRKCCGISFKPLEELNVSLVFVEENQGLRQPLDDDTFYFHNSTLTELEELKADCHLCYLMVDALRPENAEVNMLDSDEGQVFLVLRKDRRSSVVREPISYDVHVWAGQSKGHLVCKMFSDSISEFGVYFVDTPSTCDILPCSVFTFHSRFLLTRLVGFFRIPSHLSSRSRRKG
ncbi:hypothetical protein VTK73DRAFT_9098 [Phialemonium thermophilum]|uniref:Uncharacterized protein n=1 Tax=Phialemonium thermophilum TaxID=223376 RepID=A0ABR3XMK5_9PEZI